MLLLLLSAYYPLRRRDGEVMGLLMITYPITRFVVELLRNDEGAFFAGMTISQNISVALFSAGIIYWAWLLQAAKATLPRSAVRPHAPNARCSPRRDPDIFPGNVAVKGR